MNAEWTLEAHEVRQRELMAEAQAAVAYSANALRSVRERFRPDQAAGTDATGLVRLDLAVTSLERIWLLLSPHDASLVSDPGGPVTATDVEMRIVEAQEAERTRLAREIHDGPAQTISNAIFQIEIVKRLLGTDSALARDELESMRVQLRRELVDIRALIVHLRPPILDDLGLVGAIRDAVEQFGAGTGIAVAAELDPGIDALPDAVETVVLRILQEALQNVRRHADAHNVTVRAVREGGEWMVEVEDDGHGFEAAFEAAHGHQNFGLQFMRERAELIGARFEVRSSPDTGTVVRIAIPRGVEENE